MDQTPGPRDHLITQPLDQDLRRLDPQVVVTEPLDPAEGPDRLARHGMQELVRELTVSEAAEDQAERLNGVLRQLSNGNGSPPAEVAL
ncbi:MAG TPA: hypothetical protein VFO01_01485, partial [Trebonia sp.]|nr:hypothetical protein [Trebonia sp.]